MAAEAGGAEDQVFVTEVERAGMTTQKRRHSGERRNPVQDENFRQIPAFAGMTKFFAAYRRDDKVGNRMSHAPLSAHFYFTVNGTLTVVSPQSEFKRFDWVGRTQ